MKPTKFLQLFFLITIGITTAFSFVASKHLDSKSPFRQESKGEVYYKQKGFQTYPEFRLAIKSECLLNDVSLETPGNNDLAIGCVANQDSKERLVMIQITAKRFPAGYKDATVEKKKEIEDRFFDTFRKIGKSKEVVFKNNKALVVDYTYQGVISARSIVFIKGAVDYSFTIMTNDKLDEKFNKLSNNVFFY